MLIAKKIAVSVLAIVFGVLLLNPVQFVFAAENLTPTAKSSILIDADSGIVLSEKDSTQNFPIASVTKQMSVLLVLESIEKGVLDPEKMITASKNASSMGGSQVFLDANANYKAKELLKAMIVASANDASVALAEEIAGSEDAFVQMMNKKAEELGLENTNYENCTGLPAPSHYSCAKDVAKVMKELIKFPLYFEYSQIWMEDFKHESGRVTQMSNTNKLVKFYDKCDAGKTGFTHEAGFCLCATAKQNDLRLVSVVLGCGSSKDRFNEAKALFEWGFNTFQSTKLVDKNSNYSAEINVQKAATDVVICPESSFSAISKKGEKPNFEVKLNLKNKIVAPLKKGEIVGEIQVLNNFEPVKNINLVVMEDVKAKSLFQTTKIITKNWV